MSENTLIVRFRAYAPDDDPIGILPHPLSWEAGIPLNDMSSLTMTYPDGSEAANLLKNPCEVALELRNPATGVFTEYPGCRFINIKSSMDMAIRPRILSFTMPSYGWMLKKARFMDLDNPKRNKENRIVYPGSLAAARPIKELLDLAKNRQNIPGLTYTFTGITDSSGMFWTASEIVSGVEFELGQDAWSILDAFSRQGLFDWRMNGRELELYKTNTELARVLDTDTGIHVHSMLGISEEPVERTWEETAGQLLVIGDGTTAILQEAPPSTVTPWGKWDESLSAAGINNKVTLRDISNQMLRTKYKSRAQFTKRFVWTEGAPLPLIDYRQGDFIRAMDDTGSQKASMRVYQITLSGVDPYGVSVALTLNDRFTDRALQVERWVNRGTGGGGPVGGGGTGAGGGKPSPPPVNSTPPKTPTGVSVTNAPYFSELGDPVSMADVAFTVVTQDILDNDADIDRYNLSARRSDLNAQQARVFQIPQPNSPSTGQVIHGRAPLLDSGFTYFFSVQAVRESGYTSDWTAEIPQIMAYPTESPEIPSTPILSTKLSTVKAEWDGRDESGSIYDPTFREVQVEASVNNVNWFHVGDIFSPGSSVIMSGKGGVPTWNVGNRVYVRFVVRNSASVISAVSSVSSIIVVGVIGPDVQANSITANEIAVGTLTAEQISAHSLSVDRLSVGDPANMMIDPALTSPELNAHRLAMAGISSTTTVAWSIANGALRVDNNSTGNGFGLFGLVNSTALMFPLATSPGPTLSSIERAIPVNRPFGANGSAGNIKARFTVVATGVPAAPGASTVKIAMLARQFTRNGVSTPFSGIIIQDNLLAANGTYTIQATAGLEIASNIFAIIPYVYAKFEGGVSVDVALTVTNIEVWQEGSVFIGDGLIRSPLIEANAITTDKLNASAITAKHSIRSAYYEMISQGGGATIKITENANFSGQSGIMWDGLTPGTGSGPRIFQADAGGSGGWDPRGLILTGPEQVTNSSGRIDLQIAYGVTGSHFRRAYGAEQFSAQGIFWDNATNRFRIGGMFNTTHFTNDMFRMDRVSFQNGTYSYGAVTARTYYPIITPNGGTTPVTSSILDFPSGTNSGFRYVSSAGTTEVFFIAACGTP